ncbi:MAG TPA: DNA polymerase III subunit beta [Anaerolineae bacterium]|nr:DNA polymerase III subunit beta [Anaerolineae bacterium]
MKLTSLKDTLDAGLDIVARAVRDRSTLPVLSNVLLATDDGRLKLAATNLEIGITCWIGAQVEADGAITVPARTFTDLVDALPPGTVDMSLNGAHTLKVQSGRFKNNLKGIAAEEFPAIPGIEGDSAVHIAPDALKETIDQVIFAAAKDESRPILTGALAKFDGDRFTLVAADGFRLSVRTAQLCEPVGKPVAVIVPARALAELRRIIGKHEEPIAIAVNAPRSQIGFKFGNVELVSQVIDGKYPDYNLIMPKRRDARAALDTGALLKACQAAEVFARDSSNTLRLTVVPGGESGPGRVIVQAASGETGDNAGEVDAVVEGTPLEIAFNVSYLIEALKAMGTPQVALELTTPSSPGVIRPVGDDKFTHVIMPMHLGGR